MLVQKKIEKSRLMIYIAIIVIMIGGTIFFIYKNYSLKKSGGAMVIEAPTEAETAESGDYSLDKLSETISINGKESDQSVENKIISPAVKAEDSADSIDLDLLLEPKFKMLEANTLISGQSEPGRSNPFIPY